MVHVVFLEEFLKAMLGRGFIERVGQTRMDLRERFQLLTNFIR